MRRLGDRVIVEGDMESFPVYAVIHAPGYKSVTTRYLWYGDRLRSGFDRFPLHDGTLYGQEKEKFKDLNIEKGIDEGKLVVSMEKGPERMKFRLLVLGKRGIPLDGLEIICDYIVQDGRCFSPGGRNLVINQLTPEKTEVILSVRGDGKMVDVRYLSAPFYEPHPRITFTADEDGLTREIRLTPR
jgi:hypothetical protein